MRNAAALCSGDLPPRTGWLTPRLLLAADRKPPKPAEGSPAAGAIEEGIIDEEKYLEQRTNTRAPEEVQLQEEEPEPPPPPPSPEAEMAGMKLSALKRRARKAGVSEEELDAADDTTQPKARVIALIRENEPPPPSRDLATGELRLKLWLKLWLKAKRRSRGRLDDLSRRLRAGARASFRRSASRPRAGTW